MNKENLNFISEVCVSLKHLCETGNADYFETVIDNDYFGIENFSLNYKFNTQSDYDTSVDIVIFNEKDINDHRIKMHIYYNGQVIIEYDDYTISFNFNKRNNDLMYIIKKISQVLITSC